MIDILLATYNGEKYLPELLESLRGQTERDWQLIVVDDCSTDSTVGLLENYASGLAQKVTILRNEKAEGCGKNNFMKLLTYSESPYFMFCDQDDVWLPEKIEKTLALMKETESKEVRTKEKATESGQVTECRRVPTLVHTDLQVVDGDLQKLQESFFAYSNLRKDFSLRYLLCQNSITGCTLMGNDLLRKIALDKEVNPDRINMHDEWLGLIACCFGRIAFLDQPTIMYRQHGENTVGATDAGNLGYQLKRLMAVEKLKKSNMDHVREASYFLELYGRNIHNKNKKAMLESFAGTEEGSAMQYRKTCLQRGILKYPWKRSLIQVAIAQK